MGEYPEWYRTIVAARWLGVPPWDLIERPAAWQEWAIAAADAQSEANEKLRRKRGRKGSGL